FSDTMLVVCPEHAKTFQQDGWSKNDLRQFLWEKIRRPLRELRPGVNGGEGVGVSMLRTEKKEREPATDDTLYPKFAKPENIAIIVAGGTAGRFSAAVQGWAGGDVGSKITTKEIRS
ncbi:MAG: TlpA family protein disulfide reductase, partial [Deltaproteobacteria bacterium]|nr:TlpA family protein disulfide reductase [Deltaproteobacteria bacterium]